MHGTPTVRFVSLMYDLLVDHDAFSSERDAMGADEYHPISHQGTNLSEAGGIGYTVVDSIDTMRIMGLDDEVARARKWVEEQLTFDKDGSFSTFEVHLIPLFTCSMQLNSTAVDNHSRTRRSPLRVPPLR